MSNELLLVSSANRHPDILNIAVLREFGCFRLLASGICHMGHVIDDYSQERSALSPGSLSESVLSGYMHMS